MSFKDWSAAQGAKSQKKSSGMVKEAPAAIAPVAQPDKAPADPTFETKT